MTPKDALTRFFPGIPGFRDRQRDALERVWAGRSSLVLMPTGSGKSLIYQLPVFALGGVGVILSPLIALMRQQAERLGAAGARVLDLGGASARDVQERLRRFDWSDRAPTFLFLSPERAETDGYIAHLLRRHRDRVRLVAIDEAHCISQWGHDFRPPYKALPGFLDRSFGADGWPPLVCLTATLDAHDQRAVLADFRLTPADVVRSRALLRTNLDLRLQRFASGDQKRQALAALLDEHRGPKLIVYAHRKRSKTHGTRALAAYFAALGHACAPFDADLPPQEKDDTLARFEAGDLRVVFATDAFGMGVDIPNIRGVIHYLLPESIEQNYQEVGRAGRDGAPAFGRLLHNDTNTRVRRDMIEKARRTPEQVRAVWDELFRPRRPGLVRTISPWTEFQGHEDEYALFHAFQRRGAIEVVARGPNRFRCFAAKTPDAEALLARLDAATRTGATGHAARRLGLEIADVIGELFRLYDAGALRLARSPDKTLFFRARPLTDEDVAAIAGELDAVVDKRLAGFEELVALIASGADPAPMLRARFDA